MAVVFRLRSQNDFEVTGTHKAYRSPATTKKFLIYDGIREDKEMLWHYVWTDKYKLYYDLEGDVGMKGLIIDAAYKADKENYKLSVE